MGFFTGFFCIILIPMWWKSVIFREDQWYCWRLSGAEIFVCRKGSVWSAFCRPLRWARRSVSCTGPAEETPALFENVQTKILAEETAALRPFLPEKPFLVNLSGLQLFPGMEIMLELELPPSFRLLAANSALIEPASLDSGIIFDFAPFQLKESWYGKNTMEGCLCSSLPVVIPRAAGDVNPGDAGNSAQAIIHCTVVIRNRAKTTLEPDKILFFAEGLAVYEIDGRLVSDSPIIEEHGNDFHITGITSMADHGTLLVPGSKNKADLFAQGTRIIKNITGL